jgi:hypothetical protein
MLAYSVFSLRLSEDVPSQSDSVHLISLYLTVCMFFSLSAMTWFAIVNKLREKKRLPYWLRWLALNYISWIVFARSMHRKVGHAVKQEQLKASPVTPSTPIAIPLQQITPASQMENFDSYYFERDSLLTEASPKIPLLQSKNQPQTFIEHMPHPITTTQCNMSPAKDTSIPLTDSPSTPVWVPRRATHLPLSSTTNGPLNTRPSHTSKTSTQCRSTKLLKDQLSTKNKESLYAIHIYNRLVFLIFFLTVIIINIYTWFFYSRSVRTKLLDSRTPWSCFDESRLEIVNCSDSY